MVLRLPPTGDAHPDNPGEAVLNPSQVVQIEQKIDDGTPNTGRVIADDAADSCWDTTTLIYNELERQGTCLTAFRIR